MEEEGGRGGGERVWKGFSSSHWASDLLRVGDLTLMSNVYTADFALMGWRVETERGRIHTSWRSKSTDTAQTLGRKLKAGSEARTLYVLGRVMGWLRVASGPLGTPERNPSGASQMERASQCTLTVNRA